jgi:DNA adenine methylase
MKPLFRWTGGKTRLLPTIKEYLPAPESVNHYFEPFAGGAALFFDYGYQCMEAWLNDINKSLITAYSLVATNVDYIERELLEFSKHGYAYSQLKYDFNHNRENGLSALQEAALFVALNHLCFNGIWRENKKGEFNVPVGRYSDGSPRTLSSVEFEHLRKGAELLKRVNLTIGSFSPWPFICKPSAGDVVFYDSPYLKEFSSYSKEGFTVEDHKLLNQQALAFAENGATVVVCGSTHPASIEVYGPPTHVVTVNRTVGASNRGKAEEALWIWNGRNQ